MADEDDLFHVTHAQKVSALYTVAALGIPIQCRTAADAKVRSRSAAATCTWGLPPL